MNEIVVRPLRFSADVQAMRRFLELVGLRSRVEAESGGWITMVAGSGMVALHDSATSDTGGLMVNKAPVVYPYSNVDELLEAEAAGGRKRALPGLPQEKPYTERP